MNNSSARNRAFTLVEILVVIGVIALLAAILFPVLSRVREGGRTKACGSNMHQLGLAFQQYAADSNRYPDAGAYQYWQDGGQWVAGTAGQGVDKDGPPYDETALKTANVEGGALFPYVRDTQVYSCPSNSYNTRKKLTYSMNCAIGRMSPVRIRTPQDIVLLVDEERNNDGFFYATDNAASGAVGTSTDALTKLHNGGGNLLFTDGHVKWYSVSALPLVSNADNSEAATIKYRMTGEPRFHDKAFGPKGSFYIPKARTFNGNYLDQCYAPIAPVT